MNRQQNTKSFKAAVVAAFTLCLLLCVGTTTARAADGAATVTASALYMRSEPSTSSSAVTCLPRGTVVVVMDDGEDWCKVWYRGQEGYMSSDYLSLSESADSAFGTGTIDGTCVRVRSGASTSSSILSTENTGETMDVTGISGNWYKVRHDGSTGYVHSDYLTLSHGGNASSGNTGKEESKTNTETELSGTGTINGMYVRMRSGPSTGHSILGSYNRGATMDVTGSSGDWYKVRCNDTDGYVYKTYLTLSSGSNFEVTDREDTKAVVTGAVHMRTGPSTSYSSLRVLGTGTEVTITGSSGKWYQIDYNGSTGYAFNTYLSTDLSSASSGSESASSAGEALVNEAKKYQGVRYVYGGTSPSGFDCSGFVYYVYKQCGYSITRTATAQNSDGEYVSRADLQPGDIIIFYNSAKTAIGHAGIYIGNGQFIHASSGSGKVVITNLSANYYNTHYYSARRVVD